MSRFKRQGGRDRTPSLRVVDYISDTSDENWIGQRILVCDNGCWLFKGRADQYGHTTLRRNGVTTRISVHRFVWQTLIGEIPSGWHIHHRCETPGCCNPEHLAAVPPDLHAGIHSMLRERKTGGR